MIRQTIRFLYNGCLMANWIHNFLVALVSSSSGHTHKKNTKGEEKIKWWEDRMKLQNLESNQHFLVGLSHQDRSTTSFMSDAGRWNRARKNHWKEVTMDRRRNQKEEEESEIIKQVTVVVIITNSVALCYRKRFAKFDAPGAFSVMKPILPFFFFFWRTPRISSWWTSSPR